MTAIIRRRELKLSVDSIPCDSHPVLDRIYRARGITSPDQLDRSLRLLHPFSLLSGIQKGVELLYQVFQDQQSILVVGDFDADGATSCALAVRGLRKLGVTAVDYLIPNRFEYGYGLTPEIVAVAADKNPHLIITVDNGISSIDGVKAANQRGIKVLVTDHHLPGHELPEAETIINPNLAGDKFPSKNLAGVGTIFYLMMALRAYLREQGWFVENKLAEPNLAELLDLVALGTVADVVPLDHNNRIMVTQGLARIRSDRCCPGISAIAKIAGKQPCHMVAADLGFAVGPRLNAAGRIRDMSMGVECLLTDDWDTAMDLAAQLNSLNLERRSIENNMKGKAFEILNKLKLDKQENMPVALCLYHEDWHQGVMGVLASRLKDKYHRPVVIFAGANQQSEQGDDLIKGSARSVTEVHIRDAIEAVETNNPGLVIKYGGHAMAAGLTLKKQDFAKFNTAFVEEIKKTLGEVELVNVVLSDGELTESEMCLSLAEQIRAAGPWGKGFPDPIFDGVLDVLERRIVGENHLKLKLRLPNTQAVVDAIAFNNTDKNWPEGVKSVQVAYKLDVNIYRGVRNMQLMIDYLRPIAPLAATN